MENKTNRAGKLMVVLLFLGIFSCYILQMAPSPILTTLGEHYGILDNNALLNLAVNIMYPFVILGCFTGGPLEGKIRTRNLFIVTLLLVAIGSLLNFAAAGSYVVFLLGRALFGLGFGFGVPFIGSAIMQWFTPKGREKMNTLNGFFPFIGTLVSFSLVAPIQARTAGGWQLALGLWGIIALVIMLLWIILVPEKKLPNLADAADDSAAEKGVYGNLFRRKTIILLIVCFALDFTCYSYISTIFPTLIAEAGGMSEELAGILASIAFPGIGLIGALLGGFAVTKIGKRKQAILVGLAFSLVGCMIASLGAQRSVYFVLIGVALFGLGNGYWLPSLYCIPCELEDMTAARVGTAFALFSGIGFAFGFFSPIIGGLITDKLMPLSGYADYTSSHVFGLRWSLFIFGLLYVINLICASRLKETGPGRA